MKHLKYFSLTLILIILLASCKRKCTDENADNYKEDRTSTCDYSHADNWDKKMYIDSIFINGYRVNLLNESQGYSGAEFDDYEYNHNNKKVEIS